MSKIIHVAVGVIQDPHKRILLAKRPQELHQGGKWEFPGGKLEPKETSRDALTRELDEELGIRVTKLDYLTQFTHDYDDFTVCLDVWLVQEYTGIPSGQEGQVLAWQSLENIAKLAIPPANEKIIQALKVSGLY